MKHSTQTAIVKALMKGSYKHTMPEFILYSDIHTKETILKVVPISKIARYYRYSDYKPVPGTSACYNIIKWLTNEVLPDLILPYQGDMMKYIIYIYENFFALEPWVFEHPHICKHC